MFNWNVFTTNYIFPKYNIIVVNYYEYTTVKTRRFNEMVNY